MRKTSEKYVEDTLKKFLKENGYIPFKWPKIKFNFQNAESEHKPDLYYVKEDEYIAIECKGLRKNKKKFSKRRLYTMTGQCVYYKYILQCKTYLAIPYHGGDELPDNIQILSKILSETEIGLIIVKGDKIYTEVGLENGSEF